MHIKNICILIILSTILCLTTQNIRGENDKKTHNFNKNRKELNLTFLEDLSDDILSNPLIEINENDDISPWHGAKTLFIAGFLRGLEVFRNVTHKRECLAILPVIHDDIVDICDRLHNVTDYQDMIDASRFILDKIEIFARKYKTCRPHCKQMFMDVRKVFMKVQKHLQGRESQRIIFKHLFENFGHTIQIVENMKDELRQKHFYQGGIQAGSLAKFVFLWDFEMTDEDIEPINITPILPNPSEITENGIPVDFDFNFPPFKFE
jgi:hypothetical protein